MNSHVIVIMYLVNYSKWYAFKSVLFEWSLLGYTITKIIINVLYKLMNKTMHKILQTLLIVSANFSLVSFKKICILYKENKF